MHKKVWEIERDLRKNAVPVDRRKEASDWYEADFKPPYGDDLVNLFWYSRVPGSHAPEIPFVSMVQAKCNLGFNVTEAEKLLPECLALHKTGKVDDLRALTTLLISAIFTAPLDLDSDYHQFDHPQDWQAVRDAMGEEAVDERLPVKKDTMPERIYQSWLGQLAGGSFGTAIEVYTGEQIAKVYGKVDFYIIDPDTLNDDIVYELVLLDVVANRGRDFTSKDIALEWVRQIPFGWSAE